jgi:hypothetical protein
MQTMASPPSKKSIKITAQIELLFVQFFEPWLNKNEQKYSCGIFLQHLRLIPFCLPAHLGSFNDCRSHPLVRSMFEELTSLHLKPVFNIISLLFLIYVVVNLRKFECFYKFQRKTHLCVEANQRV